MSHVDFPRQQDEFAQFSPHRTSNAPRLLSAILLALGTALAGLGASTAQAEAPPAPNSCPEGTFCAYPGVEHRGAPHRANARTTPPEKCSALPQQPEVQSFINRTGKPVTVYQDPECDPHADFATYPSGAFVPRSDFVPRAIKVWSH